MTWANATAGKQAEASGFDAACDSGSYFEIRAGSTILGNVPLNAADRWTGPVAGVLTLAGVPLTLNAAVAAGTADNFILRDSGGTALGSGTVGVAGDALANRDLVLDSKVIGIGDSIVISSGTLTFP